MKADCVIITAIPTEFRSVLFQFRHFSEVVVSGGAGAAFVCYETLSPNGLRVIAALPTGMGTLGVASLTHHVISTFQPKALLLVGIAGGMDKEISLGDVVVSEQIVDYELGKVTAEGFGPRWSVYRPDAELLARAKAWPTQTWQQYIRTPRPTGKGQPALHSGVFLSGNKVIADEKSAGALRSVWRKAAAIEMEAAGVASVLYHLKEPPAFLVFKSISDHADSQKNNDWQPYAADAAASCAFSFVLEHLRPLDIQAAPASRTKREPPGQSGNRALRVALASAYNIAELKQLCFDLGVDWDEISGNTKSEKIVELVLYVRRRSKFDELVDMVNRERENLLKAYVEDLAG
jgi:nucleoside phosphorylase